MHKRNCEVTHLKTFRTNGTRDLADTRTLTYDICQVRRSIEVRTLAHRRRVEDDRGRS
jgi:hypothetical protein